MIIFREGYHNIHTDNEADEMMKRILQWMNERRKFGKWKQTSAFKLDTILKMRYFWRKSCAGILILLLILKLAR